MLDFTCCVMFFNYWLTEMPGGAELTRQNALNLLLLIVLAVNPGIDNQRHDQRGGRYVFQGGLLNAWPGRLFYEPAGAERASLQAFCNDDTCRDRRVFGVN